MYLLWFAGYNNSVDFIGLFPTEWGANIAKGDANTPWHKRNGEFKISYVERCE